MVARKLGEMRLLVCASPDYLARHGRPRDPQELSRHTCLIDTNLREPRVWSFRSGPGTLRVPVRGMVTANSASAIRTMVLAGHGIGLCPDFAVAEDLAAGRLEVLLGDFTTAPRGIHAVYPHRRHLARRLRLLIDFLEAHLSAGLPVPPHGTPAARSGSDGRAASTAHRSPWRRSRRRHR